MHQNREKNTVITANLRHWLRRIYCCRSQECRAGSSGFTLAEILLVVVIIAIAAMIAVPMMSSADSVQIRSAANMIAADLEYAKSMAISRQENYSVVFNPANSYYEVHDPNGIIEHPVKKGFNYKVDFSSDSRLDKVVIDDADFAPDSSNTITFDYLGSPYSGSGSGMKFLNSGAISIRAGDFTETISVEPVTGFISITD
jgi:prepilin-type N-terminal cleavage/methylation domain-containing protein